MAWFGWSLLALLAVSLTTRDRGVIVPAATLFGNWVVNTLLADNLGSQFEWPITASVDWVSAIALIACCSGRLRLVLAATYAIQVLMHVAYGVSERISGVTYAAQVSYWDGLFALAILQALLVGVWVIRGHYLRYRRPDRRALPDNAGAVPVARGKAGK